MENYQSKPYIKHEYSFLQDFHHLDHSHFHGYGSSNTVFGAQKGSNFDSFDAFPYGSSSNMEFYDYECKPFVESCHSGLARDSSSVLSGERGFNLLNQMGLNLPENKSCGRNLIPDEVSCVTANNSVRRDYYYTKVGMNQNRINSVTKKSWRNRKKSNVVKGQWTIEEDRVLSELVEQYGIRKWSHIAHKLPGRIGKQCRERWHNHLRPNIKKETWSEEEDRILIKLHSEIGNKWAEIAKKLPGRTENSIKNHWNATKRRQYSKRKCRSKYPRASLLQEYIKSLNLDSVNAGRNGVKTTAGNTNTAPKKPPIQQPQTLVPQFEFNEVVLDFDFDDGMFQEGCNIDTLLEEIPCVPGVDFESMEVGEGVSPVVMELEVKKEMDLMEMISQGKI